MWVMWMVFGCGWIEDVSGVVFFVNGVDFLGNADGDSKCKNMDMCGHGST